MAVYNLWNGTPAAVLDGDIINYPFRNTDGQYGGIASLTLPKGIYKLEAWGSASGILYDATGWSGQADVGTGGYAKGTLTLGASTVVYLHPGGVGYNGGYSKYYEYSTVQYWAGSGGGSDFRLLADTPMNRVLVAGGGGMAGTIQVGGDTSGTIPGGGGGGSTGTGGTGRYGGAGTQTTGGVTGPGYNLSNHWYNDGGFGNGGTWYSNYGVLEGMGGGGWYGGGAGGTQTTSGMTTQYPGGGGSGFVLTSSTAGNTPSGYALGSAYYLTDAETKTGKDSGDPITEPNGSTATDGHRGDGYLRITVIVGQLASPRVTSVTEPTEGTLRIAWSAVTNATGYRVTDENGNVLATLTSSPYTESGIVTDQTYVRKIIATSEQYAESAPTTVTYGSAMKLDTPTNLRASYTVNATKLSWSAVNGATSYALTRNGTQIGSTASASYTDYAAGTGTSYTYTVTAKATGRWDSAPASITTTNKGQMPNVTNLSASQTASAVTLTWTGVTGATGYTILRDGTKIGTTTGTSYTDATIEDGTTYKYTVVTRGSGKYDSSGASVTVGVLPRLETPDLIEASQTQSSTVLNWAIKSYGATVTFTLRRDGEVIYRGSGRTYTDTGLTKGTTYIYTLVAAIPGSGYYDSLPATLYVLIGRFFTPVERQTDYLKSLRRPFTKLCRLRFLNPNGTTAFALDNNPKNARSRAFIAEGSVTANLQNGQRMSATVTLDNADNAYETAVNKVWFGQEVALDEGLVLSNGEEYYRQTGVFVIDNPTEKADPKTKTVTYRLLDKWAELDGTLGGNLEGTYEVEVGTNIFAPITSLLTEDRGNGQMLDPVSPVYTDYYNDKTQELPDGTTAQMTDSPYTLTVNGDGGTKAQVILGLAAMVNAWVGYDNTGRLRIDPSQDDILDINKPVLWRFTPEEAQLLGMTYTVKKEDVYNDYIVVGEMLDDYTQPGGRATNYDPRSDTNVYLIGRKTKRESASGYATDTQCRDLAEWRLKRSSILQRAVSLSCIQMMHIDLNSLVEIVRTDKPGNPVERHLIQGYTRPLAYNGAMTINAVSVNDLPIATLYGPDDPPDPPGPASRNGYLRFTSPSAFTIGTPGNSPLWDGTMEWSTDGTSWQEWDGSTISSGSGNTLYLRGVGNTKCSNPTAAAQTLVITGSSVSADGTVESLLDGEITAMGGHPRMANGAFKNLFYKCSALIQPPEFTATQLTEGCYQMALAETGITSPPALPATTMARDCYWYMLEGCTELAEAPVLPAMTLAQSCYYGMLRGCTRLSTPPKLPAQALASACYQGMFEGCTGLTKLPQLTALAMESGCYESMFINCSGIRLSTAQGGNYVNEYRIPSSGTGIDASRSTANMFSQTGGAFTGTPSINTTYYTSNTVLDQ